MAFTIRFVSAPAGSLRGSFDHLDREKISAPTDVADERVFLLQLAQAGDDVVTNVASVVEQALVSQDIQHGQAHGSGHRVAAKCVEIHVSAGELLHEIGSRDHARQGMTVAHRLSHRDDVRQARRDLVTPHVRAEAPEAGLHLVGDE